MVGRLVLFWPAGVGPARSAQRACAGRPEHDRVTPDAGHVGVQSGFALAPSGARGSRRPRERRAFGDSPAPGRVLGAPRSLVLLRIASRAWAVMERPARRT